MMANELYHHGVLGMKWGVRKDNSGNSSSRRRSIKRGALIVAGLLATGVIAYGLYKTGAYKQGADAVQSILSGARKSAKKQLKTAGHNALNAAKTKVVDTLDDDAKIASVQNKATLAKKAIDIAKPKSSSQEQVRSKARYQASKEIYEANKAYRARAEKAAAKAAKQKVSDIPKGTKDAGRKRLSKIFDRIGKQTARNKRAVDNFNEQNSKFINNLGNMGH